MSLALSEPASVISSLGNQGNQGPALALGWTDGIFFFLQGPPGAVGELGLPGEAGMKVRGG